MNFFQKDDGYWGKRQANREEEDKKDDKKDDKEVKWLGPAKEPEQKEVPKLETYNDDAEEDKEEKDGKA